MVPDSLRRLLAREDHHIQPKQLISGTFGLCLTMDWSKSIQKEVDLMNM